MMRHHKHEKQLAELLIEVLARTDAVFIPLRVWEPRTWAQVVVERRRAFDKTGIRWGWGGTPAERQEASRSLAILARQELVRRYGRGERMTAIRLTDKGEREARRLAGLPCFSAAVALVLEVARLEPGSPWGPGHGLAETELVGHAWGETKDPDIRALFVAVEDQALPALIRRWLFSNSTGCGQLFYRLGDNGCELLAESPDLEAPEWAQPLKGEITDAADGALRGRYFERLEDALARLRAAKPDEPRDIGEIPLSQSYET